MSTFGFCQINHKMKKSILFIASIFITSFAFAQHAIVMKNGDKIEGLVTSLNNGVIEIHKNQTVSKINLSEVSEIIFDKPGTKVTNEIGEKTITAGPYQVRYKVADRVIAKA